MFPCSPEINWLVPLFPKNRKFCFLMFPVPQYCLLSPVPLKIWPLFPCSPKINTLFPCSPKPLGGSHILFELIDFPTCIGLHSSNKLDSIQWIHVPCIARYIHLEAERNLETGA